MKYVAKKITICFIADENVKNIIFNVKMNQFSKKILNQNQYYLIKSLKIKSLKIGHSLKIVN